MLLLDLWLGEAMKFDELMVVELWELKTTVLASDKGLVFAHLMVEKLKGKEMSAQDTKHER